MAGLGFFLGGMAQGYQDEQRLGLQQKSLQIQQQALQNQQQRDQNANYMKIRSDAVAHLDETINALKVAHPDWGPMQIASNPAVMAIKQGVGQLDQNLKLPNTIDSIVASLAEKPSQATTERTLAQARDPNKQALEASEIAKNQAAAKALETNAQAVSGQGDETTDFFAQQLLEGNQTVLNGFSRSASGVAMRMKIQQRAAQMAIEQGLTPADVNANVAQFMGEKAGANALGRREAQVIGAATTATKTAPRVLETSAAVDRTQYPSLNAIILAARQGTGDEKVIKFGIAASTFINNYARALGAGNAAVTDAARKEAFENLSTAWSKGQVAAAIDQMLNKELPSEIEGAKAGMGTFLHPNTKKPGSSGGSQSKPQYKFNPDTGELE